MSVLLPTLWGPTQWNLVWTSRFLPVQPLPPSITQLGMIDTLHYVGYGMTDIGLSLANLQVHTCHVLASPFSQQVG
jgi:hypothetical protein